MQYQVIDHSQDLLRLRNEGFEIEINGGQLYVHQIPYVTKEKTIQYGILISELNLSGVRTKKPSTHVIMFTGDFPCHQDGSPILAIKHPSYHPQNLGNGIVVKHLFSNQPTQGYNDYYEKITRYVDIISGPAHSIDPTVTAKTYKVVVPLDEKSVFQYTDTNSSRANLNRLNEKFIGQKIGIVGLGGTGAYILDQIAKTQVAEIHLFDDDQLFQHNAFRSPGAVPLDILNEHFNKVDYYNKVYAVMHNGIVPYCTKIDESSISLLNQLTFVFICIDNDYYRKLITDYLVKKGIPFIDVGLGINIIDDSLIGMLRVTVGLPNKNDHLIKRLPVADDIDNIYGENIQIADLNALNALLAVIKWKKLCGFYHDIERECNSTYSLNVGLLNNEDHVYTT